MGCSDPITPLRALTAGSGPALVLLHGFGVTPSAYDRTIDLLARTRHIVAPWWARGVPAWRYDACLDSVIATIESHGLDRVTLVGHSFGGAVALGVAARRPDLVDRLVLADALALSPGLRELAQLGAKPGHIRRYASPPMLRGLTEHARRPRDLAALAWWGWRCDLAEAATAVRRSTATTVVWAADDALLPLWIGERLADALDAPLVIARGRTPEERIEHDWAYRRPRLFARTVSAVVDQDGDVSAADSCG